MASSALLNNRYELEKPLGSGGMAVVFRAQDRMLERAVAIKVLREDYSHDPAFRERFHQEAKAAANLSHPNIVTVHDFGMDTGRLFIVMEFVPGTNLNALLQSRGRFTVEEALPLLQQACAGLGYAHRAGLVHCDVKPHNLLITPDNRLKVTDFGIARALASIQPEERMEVVWGSPQYFAPEQAAGGAPSPASDVYSLGIVMYFMLTGRLPFSASASEELAQMHRSQPPPAPRQFNPAISDALEQVMLKVLAKEPAARYRTADQLGRVLIALQHTGKQAAPPRPIHTPPAAPPVPPSQVVQAPAAAHWVDSANSNAYKAAPQSSAATRYSAPPDRTRVSVPAQAQTAAAKNPLDMDWTTILLALGALVAAGGLIPFCLWVYLLHNPPR